eukprot:1403418-Prymnesium_polylepis.1
MQGNVRNLPAYQHSDNECCNPHAKWAYNRTESLGLCSTAARLPTEANLPAHMRLDNAILLPTTHNRNIYAICLEAV